MIMDVRRLSRGMRGRGSRAAAAALASAALVLGTVGWAPSANAADGVPTTYDGPSYSSSVKRPSENKPQSKLWYTDGSWWALMTTGTSTSVRIHQLMPNHTWRDTGTVVDTRVNNTGDALWSPADGKLFVASRATGSNLQVARLSYAPATDRWTVDPGFPVVLSTGGGSESATIDRDSTGRLWVTYTQKSRLWVAHSDVTGTQWTAGFQPNVGDVTISSDDISALVAFEGSIGLLWSDQQSGAFRFAIHRDGDPATAWRVENALVGSTVADDHINLKQISSDSQGRVFAAVKTSNDAAGPGATLVGVLVRTPGANGVGTWKLVPAGTVADDHTRPILMIDETNQELYFFATAPVKGGDIFYKKTSLANPSFGPGRGAKFVDSSKLVNNASGAKHPVNATTGMVVLAVAEGVKRYVHAEMSLGGGGGGGEPAPGGDTTAPSVPQGLSATAGAGRVDLRWSASTDAVGVAGYTVRRNGAVLADAGSTSYADTAVEPGRTYEYRVEAYDAAGNRSAASASASATVPASPPPPTGGGIALRGVSTAANGGQTTLVVGAPTHQAGDLLLATVDFRGDRAVTPPAGWQLLRYDENGTAVRKATYWRVAGGSEPGSYTWAFDGRPPAVVSVLAYAGVSASQPVEASSGQANPKSTQLAAAPVTTSTPGALVVGLFAVNQLAAVSPPVGMAERSEVSTPTAQSYHVTGEAADLVLASPGSSGPRTAVSTVAGPSIGQLVALRPAG